MEPEIYIPEGLSIQFWVRPDSETDEYVIREVFIGKEYGEGPFHGLVVDCGANIGAFSVFAALNGAEKVIALEPDPDNFELLVKNVQHHSLSHIIKCQQVAVSEHGVEHLYMPVRQDGNASASTVPLEDYTVEVVADTLDSILDGRTVQFLKVDTEGSEYAIFRGLTDLRQVEDIGMEYHGMEPDWGMLMRRLTQHHNVCISTSEPTRAFFGGMCLGTRRR